MKALRLLGVTLVLLAALRCAHPLDELAPFPCSSEQTCPEPFTCVSGQCVESAAPPGRDAATPRGDAESEAEPDVGTWRPDSGRPDAAALPDAAGLPDAGTTPDAGPSPVDAAMPPDAAMPDAGLGPDAGLPGTLQWMDLSLSGIPGPITGIHGQATDNLYLASGNKLVHYDGATYRDAYVRITPVQTMRAVVTVGPMVYAAGDKTLTHCTTNCTKPLSHTVTGDSSTDYQALCARTADSIYAVGWDATHGKTVLRKFDATAHWEVKLSTTTLKSVAACWVDPNQVLYLVGKSTGTNQPQVLRYESGGLASEDVDFGSIDPAQTNFNAIWGDGTQVFVGASRKRVFSKAQGSSQWSVAFNPSGIADLWAISGAGGVIFAGGEMHTSADNQLLQLSDGQWGYVAKPPVLHIQAMWSVDAWTHFLAGRNAGGFPAMFRSYRIF